MLTRRSIAPLLFLLAGVLLLAAATVWLAPKSDLTQQVAPLLPELIPPDGNWLDVLVKIGSMLIGAAITLLVAWHFMEMNLPRRLQGLIDRHSRAHIALRPEILEIARAGLRFVPTDIEMSRLTLLRWWLSGWSLKEQTRLLVATVGRLGNEARTLAAAAKAAQEQQITAHLVCGYQHIFRGDLAVAFQEFDAAARVRNDDIAPRDIAAGWARCVGDNLRERQLLRESQQITNGPNSHIDQARAFRREAELIVIVERRSGDAAHAQALSLLRQARNLLQSVAGPGTEAGIELGRVLTLFCEVRCDKGTPGMLTGPLTAMRLCMAGVVMHRRPEEPYCTVLGRGGEEYGEERALRVDRRVAELLGEGEDGGEDDDT